MGRLDPAQGPREGIYETIYTGGVNRGGGKELRDKLAADVGMTPKQLYDLTESIRMPGGQDPGARIVDMDRDGIDAAVLYPTYAMFFGPCDPLPALHDVEFVADCQRAYNDWVAEYCAGSPRGFSDRHRPAAGHHRAVARGRARRNRNGLKGV